MSRYGKNKCNLICRVCGGLLTTDTKGHKSDGGIHKKCRLEQKAIQNAIRRERKRWAVSQYLGAACEHCGKEATPETSICFDAHHIVQRKDNQPISHMVAEDRPLDIIFKEADKCILLCACCHRLLHKKIGYHNTKE